MASWTPDYSQEVKAQFYAFLSFVEIKSKESAESWMRMTRENLYGAQVTVIEKIFEGLGEDRHHFLVLKSRQLGVSTIIRALMLFWLGKFPMTGTLCFDSSQHLADARAELVDMLERLPEKFKFPRNVGNNRYALTLDNKSRVNLVAAGVKESKGANALGAGSAIAMAHRSELSNYGNIAGMESFRHSMARRNPNRLFVDESTARGFNYWKECWDEAALDTDCVRIFCGWWSHDSQFIERDHPDFERYGIQPCTREEIIKIRAVKAQYGHEITPEQLAWIRKEMNPGAATDGDAEPDFTGTSERIQEQPWCVTAETRVGTDFGMIQIKDAAEGMVGTLGRIEKSGPTGTAPIWRATTHLGYQVRGTGNHPLITTGHEQVRLDESLGRTVILQPPCFSNQLCSVEWQDGPVVSNVLITPDFARLAGLYMGDGSIQGGSKNGGAGYFAIACDKKDQDVVDECVRLVKDIFGIDSPVRQQGKTGCVELRVGSRLIVETFRKLGLARNDTGPTMRKVHVPEFIFRSPKHVVKEFLSGLFEADGFNSYDTYRCALFSKWPAFIADVQRLLLGFGITSRSVSAAKKHPDGHSFTGNQLELRAAEAISFNEQIGFLSERKKSRHANKPQYEPGRVVHQRRPITLQDKVVDVVDEGVTEPVYNLTVEGDHLFDANGILTHNTEQEAFQQTGSVFFDPGALTDQSNKNVSRKFKTYSYVTGTEFTDFRVFPAPNQKSVQLRVWEEPVEESVYIVAADVAFGHSEYNDRSAVQVLRCFADGIDQVAEYAWPLIDSRQFAWVIASLEGWYAGDKSEIYRIIEINGPGEATWRELTSLKQQLRVGYFGKAGEERGLARIQQNVRNYIYTRSDSPGQGHSYMWKTTGQLKVAIFERLRDFTNNGMLRIRSQETLEECRTITRDGDSIEAQGSAKDDRVFSLALGVRAWDERARRPLINAKRTREFEQARRRLSIQDQFHMYNTNQFETFLSGQSTARRRALQAARRQSWRSGA